MMMRRIMANYHFVWVSLCLLYFLCLSHAVRLQIASLVQACRIKKFVKLTILAKRYHCCEDSQTTPVQITHVFTFAVLHAQFV